MSLVQTLYSILKLDPKYRIKFILEKTYVLLGHFKELILHLS